MNAKPTFKIPVSNGILTPEHYQRMGDGVWYFMWCVDRTTKELADGTGSVYGIVLGGMPCHDQNIARSFGVHVNTVRAWRIKLTKEKYIQTTRTPNGYSIKVLKSKKWPQRLTENSESQKTARSRRRFPNTSWPKRRMTTIAQLLKTAGRQRTFHRKRRLCNRAVSDSQNPIKKIPCRGRKT